MPSLSPLRAAALLVDDDALLRPAAHVAGGVDRAHAERIAPVAAAAGGVAGLRRALQNGPELAVRPLHLERVEAQPAAALVKAGPVRGEAVVTAVEPQLQPDLRRARVADRRGGARARLDRVIPRGAECRACLLWRAAGGSAATRIPAAAWSPATRGATATGRAARALVARQHRHVLLRDDLVNRHRLAAVVGVGDEEQVHAVSSDVALEELVAAVGRAVLRVPALAVGAG